MGEPLLSVCLITYNHVKYIHQAIEGVLMQKVNFTWELIIADDFSTDGTREIVLEYKGKYPDFIKLILQKKNVGPAQNFMDLLTAPKSKYIAYFEGDDYWTDSYKLQKQVDFLEANPDFVLSCHNAEIINENGASQGLFNKSSMKQVLDIYDVIKCWQIPTASIVYRNDCYELPDWYHLVPNGDLALQLIIAGKGKFRFMDEVMSVYRKHSGGVSTLIHNNIILYFRGYRLLWEKINKYYNYKYDASIQKKIRWVNLQIIKHKLLKHVILLRFIKKIHHKILKK